MEEEVLVMGEALNSAECSTEKYPGDGAWARTENLGCKLLPSGQLKKDNLASLHDLF